MKYIATENCPRCGEEADYIFTEVFPVATCQNKSCGQNLVLCSACTIENCEGCFNGSNFVIHPNQEVI